VVVPPRPKRHRADASGNKAVVNAAAAGANAGVAAAHISETFSRSANEASSAAAMLKSLERLNRGGAALSGGAAAVSDGGGDGADSALGADAPPSVLLPASAPFQPGDFYVFDERRFRYAHHRPLNSAPLTDLQLLAEATLQSAKVGHGPYLVGPLNKKRWLFPAA